MRKNVCGRNHEHAIIMLKVNSDTIYMASQMCITEHNGNLGWKVSHNW